MQLHGFERSYLKRSLGRLRGLHRRFLRCTSGSVAALFAIVSPVLVGAMGLGAETGYWYLQKRNVQNAADVGAHGAAMRKISGDDANGYSAMANYVVERTGLNMAQTGTNVVSPPTSGPGAGLNGAVEVTVTQTVPRMFSAIYASNAVTVTGRAVAHADSGGSGCVIALAQYAQGAVTVSGSADVSLIGCDMVSNAEGASIKVIGQGGTVSARCVQTRGIITYTSILSVDCERMRQMAPPIADPYAAVPEPALTGACQSSSVGQNNQSATVTPIESHASGMDSIRFCNGLSLRGNVTLNPGLYLIEGGDFQINSNASIQGDGVIFFLADGVEMVFNGTADLDLSSPTSGDYAGMLIFGSRSATGASHRINGNAGVIMDGAIYTPASHLDFKGNAATTTASCTQIIGDTIEFSGNGAFSITCQNTDGNDAHTGPLVTLLE